MDIFQESPSISKKELEKQIHKCFFERKKKSDFYNCILNYILESVLNKKSCCGLRIPRIWNIIYLLQSAFGCFHSSARDWLPGLIFWAEYICLHYQRMWQITNLAHHNASECNVLIYAMSLYTENYIKSFLPTY